MLCRASITAPTLGVALERWCRHHGLLTESLTHRLEADAEHARLLLGERREFGAMREFCLLTQLRNLHGFACWVVDSQLPLREAAFPFAAPPHREAYPLMFPGPIRFGAPEAGLEFDARYLKLPLRRDEAALRTMLQRALPLTVLQYRRDRLLVARVRELLRRDSAAGVNAATLAQQLHVSVRTLHRQLHDEGASLQALKDAARRDLASELLRRSRRSIKQVAQAAGFRSDKSFARAFAGWTGVSPRAYRAQGSDGTEAAND